MDDKGYTHKHFEIKDPSGQTDDTIEIEVVTNIPSPQHEAEPEEKRIFLGEEVEGDKIRQVCRMANQWFDLLQKFEVHNDSPGAQSAELE